MKGDIIMSVNKVKTNVCVELTVDGEMHSLHEGDVLDNIEYTVDGVERYTHGTIESFKVVATRFYRHHRHTDENFKPSLYFNRLVEVIGMTLAQENGRKITVDMSAITKIGVDPVFAEDAVVTEVATAEELVDAFSTGGNIKLMSSVDFGNQSISIPNGVEVVLDLNGQTISGTKPETVTANHALIENRGVLVIEDNTHRGKITYAYTGETTNWGKSTNTISNSPNAKLVINGGTVENTTNVPTHIYYAIDNLTNSTIGEAVLEINGGKISCPNYRAIRMFCNSTTHVNKVTINGGEISSKLNAPFVLHVANKKPNLAELTINDGKISTVSDSKSRAVYITIPGGSEEAEAASAVTVNIAGGHYKGAVVVDSDEFVEGTLTDIVTGGYFTVDPSAYVAEGHSVEASDVKGYNYHVV
jgi:hypothetical protein